MGAADFCAAAAFGAGCVKRLSPSHRHFREDDGVQGGGAKFPVRLYDQAFSTSLRSLKRHLSSPAENVPKYPDISPSDGMKKM